MAGRKHSHIGSLSINVPQHGIWGTKSIDMDIKVFFGGPERDTLSLSAICQHDPGVHIVLGMGMGMGMGIDTETMNLEYQTQTRSCMRGW